MTKAEPLINYKLTEDAFAADDGVNVPEELSDQFEYLNNIAEKGDENSISKIQQLIERYPGVPQLKNYLTIIYRVRGEFEKAYAYNRQILAEHPGYLFARINIAAEYLEKEDYEKMPEALGEKMELGALYPDRKVFHVSEFTSYYDMVTRYYIARRDIEQAWELLEFIIGICPDCPNIEKLEMVVKFNHALLEGNLEHIVNELFPDPKAAIVEHLSGNITFTHKEIYWLYEEGLDFDPEKLEKILALPRKTLIADLEKILLDSINEFDFYETISISLHSIPEDFSFSLHAFFLLGELKAKESAEVIWQVMAQEEEYFDLYFGDIYLEFMWEPLYKIFHDDFDSLKQFIKKTSANEYSKSNVFDVVFQVSLHQPERKEEAVNWFLDILTFFDNCEADDPLLDEALIGFLVWSVMDLELGYIPETVKSLYDNDRVEIDMLGYYEDVKQAWDEPSSQTKRAILPINERYKHIIENWFWDESDIEENRMTGDFEDEEYTYPSASHFGGLADNDDVENDNQPIIKSPKISRNDPCPCGSGKKYKKCCMNKNQ